MYLPPIKYLNKSLVLAAKKKKKKKKKKIMKTS